MKFTSKLKESFGNWWLSVSDTGVGMSDQLLTTVLLDFGSSYWASDLMLNEHPGLLIKGFEPVGKFGIGFFSVFMLGDFVRVITRPYRDGERDTRVLEFAGGLGSVPLLRHANASEVLQDGGTRIEVLLRTPPLEERGLLNSLQAESKAKDLSDAISWLCPAVDFTVFCCDGTCQSHKIIAANDWTNLPAHKLLARCNPEARPADVRRLAERLQDVRDADGKLIGRAGACSWLEYHNSRTIYGVCSVGGFRSSYLAGIIGIFEGEAVTASREEAFPFAAGPTLASWATNQARLIEGKLPVDPEIACHIASVVSRCGGKTCDLCVCCSKDGWLTTLALRNWAREKKEVLLVDEQFLSDAQRFVDDFEIAANVLIAGTDHFITSHRGVVWPEQAKHSHPWWRTYQRSLQGLVISQLATAWDATGEDVLSVSEFSERDKWIWRDVGYANGKALNETVHIIKRPRIGQRVGKQRTDNRGIGRARRFS